MARGFGRSIAGRRVRAVFLVPAEGAPAYDVATGRPVAADSAARRYALLPAVLDQGRALRALYPNADSVVILDRWVPGYEDFELFVTGPAGEVRDLGRGLEAHAALATLLLTRGLYATARGQLKAVVPRWPDDPRLRLDYALALGRTGERAAGLAQLEELVRRAPADSLAVVARRVLAQARGGPAPRP